MTSNDFVTPPWRDANLRTEGLLFIGDPHLWSRQPDRRRDADFMGTVLGKLEFAADVANANHLWPVFLGDLFHKDDDDAPAVLNRVARMLQRFHRRAITLVGNHEKDEWVLTERNGLSLLATTGQIDVVARSSWWGRLRLIHEDGRAHTMALGGTPFGQALPYDLGPLLGLTPVLHAPAEVSPKKRGAAALPADLPTPTPAWDEAHARVHEQLGVDTVVWLSHHDLAFENAYPGSQPLHPMLGADMVVNGHIHGTKKPVRLDPTAWYNPGNITRLSIDLADHVPSVWAWTPFDNPGMPSTQGLTVPKLVQHVLPHVAGSTIFSHEGHHSAPTLLDNTTAEALAAPSEFVETFLAETMEQRSHEGLQLRETMLQGFEARGRPPAVQSILLNLLERALTSS